MNTKQLDLTALDSYSPTWPHPLRFACCIAVQYATRRLCDRMRALAPAAADQEEEQAEGHDSSKQQEWAKESSKRKRRELVEDWEDYCARFLTATCQHLGIAEEVLPPGQIKLADVLSAAQGRNADSDAASPTSPVFELGAAQAMPALTAPDAAAQQDSNSKADTVEVELADLKLEPSSASPQAAAQRSGGALTESEGKGREIEVVHELLLVALGLGQYRASDGASTLFESDALFDDPLPSSRRTSAAAAKATSESSSAASASASAQQPMPMPSDSELGGPASKPTAAAEVAEQISNTGVKTWSAIKGGAATGWKGITSVGKDTSKPGSGTASPRTPTSKGEERKQKQPTKPNDPCCYDARARSIIWVAATAMGLRGLDVIMAEKVLAQSIFFLVSEGQREAKAAGEADPLAPSSYDEASRGDWMNKTSNDRLEKEKSKASWGKWAAAGSGFVLGAVALGVTGGLAAPLVLPALAGLSGFAFLATTGGVALMGGLLGLAGGGLAGYRVTRRLRGLDTFEFVEISSSGVRIPSLHATICISGLITHPDEQIQPWEAIFADSPDYRDVYALRCEAEAFAAAGNALKAYVWDTVAKTAGRKAGEHVLKATALAGLAALTLPLTVWGTSTAILDSQFAQAKTRAYKAGLTLADVLRDGPQGRRPVILIGTSLGASTILTALLELAKDPSNAHIVSEVYLIGAPLTATQSELKRARGMVSGRFCLTYSQNDMVCKIAAVLGSGISFEDLRAGRMSRVLGSGAVDVPGVECVDVGDISSGHVDLTTEEILSRILQRLRVVERS